MAQIGQLSIATATHSRDRDTATSNREDRVGTRRKALLHARNEVITSPHQGGGEEQGSLHLCPVRGRWGLAETPRPGFLWV